MRMMKKALHLLSFTFLISIGCSDRPFPTASTEGHLDSGELSSYFQRIPVGDTLRFEVATDVLTEKGSAIPKEVFFAQLPRDLLAGFDFLDSSAQPMIIARYCFPQDADLEACLVDIRQGWFQHQSFLLHDRSEWRFTGRQTLAEFLGGDGNQRLVGSWFLDFNGDGVKDIVQQEINHRILTDGPEPMDTVHVTSRLLLWEKRGFREKRPPADRHLEKEFPVVSFW
ncbi:MAG: hypothetical protein RLY31_218 [Bacteroidota bacterium]